MNSLQLARTLGDCSAFQGSGNGHSGVACVRTSISAHYAVQISSLPRQQLGIIRGLGALTCRAMNAKGMRLNLSPMQRQFSTLALACAAFVGLAVAGLGMFISGEHGARTALWGLFATFLGAAAVWFVAVKRVLRPLQELTQAMAVLSPSDVNTVPVPNGHAGTELGQLVNMTNGLRQALQLAYGQEREMRDAIATLEAQYLQLFDFTSAGIFVLDRHHRLVHSNPTVAKVIGATTADMMSLRGEDFIPMVFVDPDQVKDLIAQADAGGEAQSADFELEGLDGESRWVHCVVSVQRTEGLPNSETVEGVIYDVTQRKRDESSANYKAEHDPLTGLHNRAAIEHALDAMVRSGKDQGRPVTVMFIDLDGFKAVNDQQGHAAGDTVLVTCAERLRGVVRKDGDLVGRLGGDELVLLLPGLDSHSSVVAQLAERVLAGIRVPIDTLPGVQARVGASIGMASFPRHGEDPATVLHAADEAMYQVKRNGKNAFGLPPQPDSASALEPAETV